jgi:hypothetical protein
MGHHFNLGASPYGIRNPANQLQLFDSASSSTPEKRMSFRLFGPLVLTFCLLLGLVTGVAQAAELLKFSGRADRAGDHSRTGSIRWEASFASDGLGSDLSAGATLDAGALLTELDGTPLVSIGGTDLQETLLYPARGARPDRAKFELVGRDRAGTRIRITERAGRIRIGAQISRAHLMAPAGCLAGQEVVALRSAVTLQIAEQAPRTWSVTHNWKCSERRSCDGCFDLKAVRTGQGHHGGGASGNREPQASIRVENLTRDPEATNWMRLDARGSKDRDGTITSYLYNIRDRSTGRLLDAPGLIASPVAYVELSPGQYEVVLTIADDQGARDTETRRFSISGEPIAQFDRFGVRWGLQESWQPGDPSVLLRLSNSVINLAEIGAIFATEPQVPAATKASGYTASRARSSENGCGSAMMKAGFWTSTATGFLSLGAGLAFGPEASMGVKVATEGGIAAAQTAGSTVSYKGGSASTSCLQNEINNLSDEVAFQGKQISQIENQLDLTDSAFVTAWMTALASQNQNYFELYRAKLNAFSPSAASTTDSPCAEATTDGPNENCAKSKFVTGGLFGTFMVDAGFWCTDVGPAIPDLCNVPGPKASAAECNGSVPAKLCAQLTAGDSVPEGSYLLQNSDNWNRLETFVAAQTGTFSQDVTALTGIAFNTSCHGEAYKCTTYEPNSELIETLDSLYTSLLAQSQSTANGATVTGQVATALAANQNILPYIDSYNQAVVTYINYAVMVLEQAFQMQWVVNNFNFFGNLPYGPVLNESDLEANTIPQLGNASSASYYPGPSGTELSCSTSGKSCSFDSAAYLCGPSAPIPYAECSPDSTTTCKSNPEACEYQYCGGAASECTDNTALMARHYTAAQLELAYSYAHAINLVFELGLRYLVTDLPVPNQSWPKSPDTGVCLLDSADLASGNCDSGGCAPTVCTSDSDCGGSSPNCFMLSTPWSSLLTSASYCEVGTSCAAGVMTRQPPLLGQPKAWVAHSNRNFEASPHQVNSPYQGQSSCAANYQTVGDYGLRATAVGDPVSGGQPGTIDDLSYVCPPAYPYCVGYVYNQQLGTCSNRAPWSADSVLYQYALNDPLTCNNSLRTYNDTTADRPPNLAGAWATNDQCPSVFQTPGGQAPRYGYFDGNTLQPYSFSVTSSSQASGCPAACSESCSAELESADNVELFACASFESASKSAPASFSGPSYSNTCSTMVGTVPAAAGGEVCPALCAAPSVSGASGSNCVDVGFAQQKIDTPLIDCQACATAAPILSLAGVMQGNLGACSEGSAGAPSTGPLMQWYAPEPYLTVPNDSDNLAMLCEGCLYLGCGNYNPLDTSILPVTSTQANNDSLATTYATNVGNGKESCSSDNTDDPACTVAWQSLYPQPGCEEMSGWNEKHTSTMATSMVSDYRCGYLGGAGLSFIGVTNDEGSLSYALNEDAQNGTYPWGCGAFGFNTIENSGTDGTTGYGSLVFAQPNAVTGLWDPPVTSDTQHIAFSDGFTASGPQIGLQIVAQCSTNCGAAIDDGDKAVCLSLATPATSLTMDTLGYACSSNGTTATSSATMECTTNDGRAFKIESIDSPGGIPLGNAGPATTLVFDLSNQSSGNGDSQTCPEACYSAIPGGDTFGAMDLNSEGACSGFRSALGYCGGYCYNQPAIETGQRIPVAAPTDCRGCDAVEAYASCPSGLIPYAGDGEPGAYCCYPFTSEGYGHPLESVFPYSTGEYGDFVMDHCPTDYYACPGSICGSTTSSGQVNRVPPAAGDSSCYPWGNTSMYPIFPLSY